SCRWEGIEPSELLYDKILVQCRFPRPSPPVCAGAPAIVQSGAMTWAAESEDPRAPDPTSHRLSDIPSIASKLFVSAQLEDFRARSPLRPQSVPRLRQPA